MDRKHSSWLITIIDTISKYNINDIMYDNQINDIRCMIYSDIRNFIINIIHSKKLPNQIKYKPEFLYSVIYNYSIMFKIVPDEITELTKKNMDYIDFKPTELIKKRIMLDKKIFKDNYLKLLGY